MDSPAMLSAIAMFRASGSATRIARQMTVPFNPPLENLRYCLLLYAACTREPLLRDEVVRRRARARWAVRRYRELMRPSVLAEQSQPMAAE